TVRDETEWVETLEGGWNVLTGASKANIADSMKRGMPTSPQTSYGDACVSARIVDVLEKELG
ncbi:MAG: UDP-N-acetylglucosamine 2-epimerase (non-hydrolyzing), partial [Methanomassiliicoccales archaeon]